MLSNLQHRKPPVILGDVARDVEFIVQFKCGYCLVEKFTHQFRLRSFIFAYYSHRNAAPVLRAFCTLNVVSFSLDDFQSVADRYEPTLVGRIVLEGTKIVMICVLSKTTFSLLAFDAEMLPIYSLLASYSLLVR